MRGGRIVVLIAGLMLVLIGVGLGIAGAVTGFAHVFQRDADGYLDTPAVDLSSDGHAVTAESLELVASPDDWAPWVGRLHLRVRVTPADDDVRVFAGIAPHAEVERYLDGVAHDEVTSLDGSGIRSLARPGTLEPAPPATAGFWSASVSGAGSRTLEWTAEPGRWAVVVMNADASPGVAVEADAGVRASLLGWIALGLLVAAVALIGAGTAMIVAVVPDDHRFDPQPAPTPVRSTASPGASPVTVVGRLDPTLGRWQWLVKWVLLIPHIVVLMALWAAFLVLTIVAGIAILVTGRYPRGIFVFNLGVLRWTWRVAFYGYGVLGTDRYPPFTLADADHPAHLDIAYPLRPSRGLVLVKSWLLALPHLIIVGLLTGGVGTWAYQVTPDRSWQISLGGGLIGLLALVAGIALLFTARYPPGLFDLLMGLNRWVFRVVAYIALMTDDYPPFRLDLGADEPSPPPAPTTDTATRGSQPTPVG